MVDSLIATNGVGIRDGHATMEEYELAKDVVLQTRGRGFKQGWARRPARGEMYGRSFLNPYRAEIQKLFDGGEADPNQKRNAGMMRLHLIDRFGFSYTLPPESEIRGEISKLVQAAIKKKSVRDSDSTFKGSSAGQCTGADANFTSERSVYDKNVNQDFSINLSTRSFQKIVMQNPEESCKP